MRTLRRAPVHRTPERSGAAPHGAATGSRTGHPAAAPHGATTGTRTGHPVPKTYRNEEQPS